MFSYSKVPETTGIPFYCRTHRNHGDQIQEKGLQLAPGGLGPQRPPSELQVRDRHQGKRFVERSV